MVGLGVVEVFKRLFLMLSVNSFVKLLLRGVNTKLGSWFCWMI